METINFKQFQGIQVPNYYEDLNQLQPGLVGCQFQGFTDEVPGVFTNENGPPRILSRISPDKILRARLDNPTNISFGEDNYLTIKGTYISNLSDSICEKGRWIGEDKRLKTILPEIKEYNKMI